MKGTIIKILQSFNDVNYERLYIFLSYDKRAKPFQGYSNMVDIWCTFKSEKTAENIYRMLCENEIKSWRISPNLLLSVLKGYYK